MGPGDDSMNPVPSCGTSYFYFPATSLVSLLYVLEEGESAEIALVGNEGVLGISIR